MVVFDKLCNSSYSRVHKAESLSATESSSYALEKRYMPNALVQWLPPYQ